jgi:hypothetical protein
MNAERKRRQRHGKNHETGQHSPATNTQPHSRHSIHPPTMSIFNESSNPTIVPIKVSKHA